jgi:hypothetical protein
MITLEQIPPQANANLTLMAQLAEVAGPATSDAKSHRTLAERFGEAEEDRDRSKDLYDAVREEVLESGQKALKEGDSLITVTHKRTNRFLQTVAKTMLSAAQIAECTSVAWTPFVGMTRMTRMTRSRAKKVVSKKATRISGAVPKKLTGLSTSVPHTAQDAQPTYRETYRDAQDESE